MDNGQPTQRVGGAEWAGVEYRIARVMLFADALENVMLPCRRMTRSRRTARGLNLLLEAEELKLTHRKKRDRGLLAREWAWSAREDYRGNGINWCLLDKWIEWCRRRAGHGVEVPGVPPTDIELPGRGMPGKRGDVIGGFCLHT